MIHSDPQSRQYRTLFSLEICFVLKSGDGRTDGRTDKRTVQKQLSLPAVTVDRPRGSIELCIPTKVAHSLRSLF